jgi:hypothetical protein
MSGISRTDSAAGGSKLETASDQADRLLGPQARLWDASRPAEPATVSVREGGGVLVGALLGALLWGAILYALRLI